MTETYLSAIVATAIFIRSFLNLRGGFRNILSWASLIFCFTFSGNVLALPLALIGYSPFEWILDSEELGKYELIVAVAMISYWAGYFLIRKGTQQWRWLKNVAPLPFSPERSAVWVLAFSLVGAIASIALSAAGFLGYFTDEAVNYSPPWWLDIARMAISVASALLFFVALNDLRTRGRLTVVSVALTFFWVFAGLAAGYKTLVVMPAVIVAVAAWVNGNLRIRQVAIIFALVWVAYIVVEPLRAMRVRAWQDNPVVALQEMAVSRSLGNEDADVVQEFLLRFDYGGTALFVLRAEEIGQLTQFKQRLDQAYQLAPLMAFIPRLLWPDKPLSDLGRELSIEIFQVDASSITPSQPVASYLWAGYLGVIANNIVLAMIVTIAGVVVLRYKSDPIRYMPALLCALALSMSDAVMANYYINCMRYALVTIALYITLRSYDRSRAAPVHLSTVLRR